MKILPVFAFHWLIAVTSKCGCLIHSTEGVILQFSDKLYERENETEAFVIQPFNHS